MRRTEEVDTGAHRHILASTHAPLAITVKCTTALVVAGYCALDPSGLRCLVNAWLFVTQTRG